MSKDQERAESLVDRLMKGKKIVKGQSPPGEGTIVGRCLRGNKPAPFPGTKNTKKGGRR